VWNICVILHTTRAELTIAVHSPPSIMTSDLRLARARTIPSCQERWVRKRFAARALCLSGLKLQQHRETTSSRIAFKPSTTNSIPPLSHPPSFPIPYTTLTMAPKQRQPASGTAPSTTSTSAQSTTTSTSSRSTTSKGRDSGSLGAQEIAQRVKLLDAFMGFLLVVGALQFLYVVIVGNFVRPFFPLKYTPLSSSTPTMGDLEDTRDV
jgi:hypothetical protein